MALFLKSVIVISVIIWFYMLYSIGTNSFKLTHYFNPPKDVLDTYHKFCLDRKDRLFLWAFINNNLSNSFMEKYSNQFNIYILNGETSFKLSMFPKRFKDNIYLQFHRKLIIKDFEECMVKDLEQVKQTFNSKQTA
ncbi:hypothetical protein ACI3PB_12300 [Glaesserella parasuis]|uniref:hypothetical protein n=2 Tax=Glaesserella parasuis TaxID=738 RepID=UPI0038538A20